MIAEAAARVRSGEQLSRAEMRDLITAIVDAGADEAAVADLLTALHARGESLEEIIGAAEGMRALATPLPRAPDAAIDTCGTGGDRSGSFNISTVAALVVAGAGVPVAKHGNRAATSLCGSADLLEELGVRLELSPERMAESVNAVGIGFLFARACHPAMARVAPIRARLDTPTIFNRLGPLTNPMYVRRQLVGIADAGALEETREALVALGAERAWVVHSEDGLDELSLSAPARVAAFESGRRREFRIEPGAFVAEAPREALLGGSPVENAAIAREVLGGAKGPRRDVVLLNAAAALCVAGRAAEIALGIEQAAAAIDSGRARELLARWIRFSADAAKSAR